jgi:very-short-patch-repair endonuclease
VEGLLAAPGSVSRARVQRRVMTPPEARLWQVPKGRQLAGLKFRRQHPIGPYVLDFYCPEAKLAVEVDGLGHFDPEQSVRDRQRDDRLQRQGLAVLWIAAEDVRTNLDGVAGQILEWAKGRLPD